VDAKPRRKENSRTTPLRNRHRERVELTRSRLLKAAEKIFARDGFEAARLEEIASEAGYTRGAFYANFGSKEELFISMVAEQADKRMAGVRYVANSASKPAARLQAMRDHYIRSLQDPVWNVLFVEYKLFILRHPELKTRVSEMQKRTFATVTAVLDEIYASARISLPVSTLAIAISLGALANTLGIDRLIGGTITENEVETVLGSFFDAIVGRRENL
jgi:AcrR family transcriptional regulator